MDVASATSSSRPANDNGGVGSAELWTALAMSVMIWLPIRCHVNQFIRLLWKQIFPSVFIRLTAMPYTGVFPDRFQTEADVVIDWCETILHHTTGGILMMTGMYMGSTRIFAYGAMSEAGGEMVDYIKAKLRYWPYDRQPLSGQSRVIMLLHHAPSIVLTLANSTYCASLVYYQTISLSLEAGGAASALFIVLSPCLMMSKLHSIILHVSHLLFFIWCRFIVYVPASQSACTFQCDPANNIPYWVCVANVAGAIMFFLFNILGLIDFLMDLYRVINGTYKQQKRSSSSSSSSVLQSASNLATKAASSTAAMIDDDDTKSS